MPEFSVKKPLTIFCCAIAILVLGIVAYTRMTPDLFPSMDFPYVIIMTADPGASPETVEETITKPMERSMATLDHIKSVSSSSADNYSMVMLEFEDDVNEIIQRRAKKEITVASISSTGIVNLYLH